MKIAPICLGCYFANTIGNIGTCIAGGMVGALVLYLIVTVILYFGANTLYIFVTGGVNSLKKYWHHIITPTLTAVATSSSAACIPINILAAKQMGVADNIVETVIPFGTNMHKDGSVAGCAIKIVFLLCVFGGQTDIFGNVLSIIGLALVCSIVVGAIPSGGMTSELLTCSILGFSPELAGTLLVISTLIDIPATLLNSSGNVVAAVWVDNGMKRMPV
ncbi:MAG: cation:dicarboxylase symporter family transporter, partial [Bacteroidaceae bacterium]|nr:cation:dicarboxylase symporter family transporter [Bacteroidaceae bacterium]